MSQDQHLSLDNAFSATGTGHSPSPALPLSLEVITLEDPHRKEEKLDQAVRALIPAALERRQGILVVQRDYGKCTVRIDQEVPCGVTYESRH